MENKELYNYNLQLTLEEINIALTGMGELQAKISMSVISKIQNQVQEQMQINIDSNINN